MLILTRNVEESVIVDGPCVIKLLAIQGNRVKLGFIGDRSTKVMRTEIIDLPKKEAMNNDE